MHGRYRPPKTHRNKLLPSLQQFLVSLPIGVRAIVFKKSFHFVESHGTILAEQITGREYSHIEGIDDEVFEECILTDIRAREFPAGRHDKLIGDAVRVRAWFVAFERPPELLTGGVTIFTERSISRHRAYLFPSFPLSLFPSFPWES
ncbi:MAG: hypothetical protein RBU27_05530 [Bacteroidota bacterium]|jgi:hypothetical protein|nr:hypothetical protein [Bacteroidota bacterium]